MNKKILSAAILTVSAAACYAVSYQETHHFKLRHASFKSDKLPTASNFTVMQISDLHNHVFGFNNEALIHTIESAKADIIVLTGDIIDKGTHTLGRVFSLVERITSRHPNVLFVSGNHEWKNGLTYPFYNGLRERNVTILDNRKYKSTNVVSNLMSLVSTILQQIVMISIRLFKT